MKDDLIVDRLWNRDESGLQQMQTKYEAYLLKVSYNILSDIEDSRECVNDTYLAAWNSIPPNRPEVLSTYLSKIVRQFSIDIFRKRNAAKRYGSEYAISLNELGESLAGGNTPDQELDVKLLRQSINQFLRKLPKESRDVFIGRYYFFDSVKRVAAYCGMTESNVKTLLFRTRQSLKEHLKSEGYEL